MKVLWFMNVPPLAAVDGLGVSPQHQAAWINSLLELVKGRAAIELGVAFPVSSPSSPFVQENVHFFPLASVRPSSRTERVWTSVVGDAAGERLVKQSLEIADRFKPDVIHIFGTEQAFGLMITRVSPPVVVQLQGILTAIVAKMYAGMPLAKQARLSMSSMADFARSVQGYVMMRKASRRERKILSMSRHLINRSEWDIGFTRPLASLARYYRYEEPLRMPFWSTTWAPPTNTDPIVVSTMRAAPYKGLELLVATFLRLKVKWPRIEFHIIGPQWSDWYPSLVRKAYPQIVNEPLFRLEGPLPPERLAEQLKVCHCYVHASHIENNCNSVCEAMLMGVPVVSTDVGGIYSMLEHKREGLLVPAGNAEAMTSAISALVENRELALTYARNARERAMRRHDPTRIMADLFGIYEDIVSSDSVNHNNAPVYG